MLALPAITIPPNPAPAVISAEMWRFRTYCLWMEAGSQDVDSGIYANKPGYHNKRNALPPTDYSVRLQADKEGPSDKASAFDWTFKTAQGGNYARIIHYSDRIEAAFNRRDPRLYGFREVLCQADTDLQAEGFDFVSWTRRTPDDSHLWHIHFSKLRKYINDRRSYDAMLSILIGQSLADWEGTKMTTDDVYTLLHDGRRAGPSQTSGGGIPIAWIVRVLGEMQADLDTLKARPTATVDTAAIVEGIVAALPDGVTLTKQDVKDALTEWFTPSVTA